MRSYLKFLMLPAVLALANCNQTEPVKSGSELAGGSNKAPLAFDESTILRPPGNLTNPMALGKTASTYYQFSIGNGLTNSDLNQTCIAGVPVWPNKCGIPTYYNGSQWVPLIPSPGGSFFEATYSDRLAGIPDSMWFSSGNWLKAAAILDNEQVEQHYIVTNTAPYTRTNHSEKWMISLDYSVNSEANYDYLWINSTADYPSCNNPGVVRAKIAGAQKSGHVSFIVSEGCPTVWLGIYFIKDGSVTVANEAAQIQNLLIQPYLPTGG